MVICSNHSEHSEEADVKLQVLAPWRRESGLSVKATEKKKTSKTDHTPTSLCRSEVCDLLRVLCKCYQLRNGNFPPGNTLGVVKSNFCARFGISTRLIVSSFLAIAAPNQLYSNDHPLHVNSNMCMCVCVYEIFGFKKKTIVWFTKLLSMCVYFWTQ